MDCRFDLPEYGRDAGRAFPMAGNAHAERIFWEQKISGGIDKVRRRQKANGKMQGRIHMFQVVKRDGEIDDFKMNKITNTKPTNLDYK